MEKAENGYGQKSTKQGSLGSYPPEADGGSTPPRATYFNF